mmetsp:Transcript_10385/g.37559  ORF Transcript_10385/g.37559 Transcript_10385/m.37559 type:complete len:223 (+) Transcript_10385:1845-2513(+)
MLLDKNDAPSSSVNNIPPMGAPNATATPAEVPIATKSRLSASLRKHAGLCVLNPSVCDPNADNPPPTSPPPCTNGPSFPAMRPLPMLNAIPPNFAMIVRSFRRPFRCTPLRYVFTSGIPLPAASGSTYDTNAPATAAKRHANATKTNHAPNRADLSRSITLVAAPNFMSLNFSMSPSTVNAINPMTRPMSTDMSHFHVSYSAYSPRFRDRRASSSTSLSIGS